MPSIQPVHVYYKINFSNVRRVHNSLALNRSENEKLKSAHKIVHVVAAVQPNSNNKNIQMSETRCETRKSISRDTKENFFLRFAHTLNGRTMKVVETVFFSFFLSTYLWAECVDVSTRARASVQSYDFNYMNSTIRRPIHKNMLCKRGSNKLLSNRRFVRR